MSVESISEGVSEIGLGDEGLVSRKVTLNSVPSNDVEDKVLVGLIHVGGNIKEPVMIHTQLPEPDAAGVYLFLTIVQASPKSGLHGGSVRRLANHAESRSPFLPGLNMWAQAPSPVAELRAR